MDSLAGASGGHPCLCGGYGDPRLAVRADKSPDCRPQKRRRISGTPSNNPRRSDVDLTEMLCSKGDAVENHREWAYGRGFVETSMA